MDIVKRLRRRGHPESTSGLILLNPDGEEAAAEIERLRAALKDMLELVEPLSFEGESQTGFKRIMDRIIQARAALSGKT